MDNQELDARATTGTLYWEGAVRVEGDDGTRGRGYLELTGYAGAIDESKALSAGYELHFSKPINLDELALTIAKLSGKSR